MICFHLILHLIDCNQDSSGFCDISSDSRNVTIVIDVCMRNFEKIIKLSFQIHNECAECLLLMNRDNIKYRFYK